MNSIKPFRSIAPRNRRGGILVLQAILLPIAFLISSFVINVAYIQLSRTELIIATDAAARAGGRAFSYYQSVEDAKRAAQITASLNTVAGAPLMVSTNDADNEIEFGESDRNSNDQRFTFTKVDTADVANNLTTATSVRVRGKRNDNSIGGRISALFPGMGLKSTYNLEQQAVATQLDRDIALILDRSGSMGWITFEWPPGVDPWESTTMNAAVDAGILGYEWVYSNGRWRKSYYYTSGNNQTSYYKWVWEDHLDLGPSPRPPWDDLVDAVGTFLNVLVETDQNEKVSLATYSTSARLDLNLVSDYSLISSTLESISPGGRTAIGEGLQAGLPSLLDQEFARPFAAKTIIVMTDGIHNNGIDPVTVAQEIMPLYKLKIHTITFGSGADQARMKQVATIGGGEHYHAETGDELIQVFEEIANNLPTLITQ